MAYSKIYLRGGATKKNTQFGEITDVFVNFDDLVEKVKSGEVKPTATGNITFSVMKKKPESCKPGEADHYLVHSYKIDDAQTPDPLADINTDDDLPFGADLP